MSDPPPSDDGRGVPAPLSELRKRAPSGDPGAAQELLAWARRRADEILGSLSPDSELLSLLRSEDVPVAAEPPAARRGGTRPGIPIPAVPAPAPNAAPPALEPAAAVRVPPPSGVLLEALPPEAASEATDPSGVPALHASPVAQVLPRPSDSTPARRHPRYDLEQPVTIHYEQWSELVELCTRDISKGGMFVKAASAPPLRSKITLRLQLPGEAGRLELAGEVVHVMGGGDAGEVTGFGVQFDELGERRRGMLDRLVEHARAMAEAPQTRPVPLAELGLGSVSESGTSLRLTLLPEEIGRLNDLRAELASMDRKDDLALLGLAGVPSQAALDEAFAALEAKWHPGRWPVAAVPEVEELAMDIFHRIEAAYVRACADVRARMAQPTAPAVVPTPASPCSPELEPETSDRGTAAPEGSGARGLVGRLLERGGRLAERLSAATRTTSAAPRLSTPELNKLIGRGFEQLSSKNYPAAIATFRSAVESRPESTKAQILLLFAEARQLVAGRKIAEARAKYEEVLKIDPGNATAQRDLVMLACVE